MRLALGQTSCSRTLNLVVTGGTLLGCQALGHDFGVGWRNSAAALAGLLLGVGGAVVHATIGAASGLLLMVARLLNVDICDTAATSAVLVVLGYGFVLVGRFGVLGDDVPSVEEAGDKAENAEQDVDERVGAADTALDPDYFYWLVSKLRAGSKYSR